MSFYFETVSHMLLQAVKIFDVKDPSQEHVLFVKALIVRRKKGRRITKHLSRLKIFEKP